MVKFRPICSFQPVLVQFVFWLRFRIEELGFRLRLVLGLLYRFDYFQNSQCCDAGMTTIKFINE